jgi:predicted secreted protein
MNRMFSACITVVFLAGAIPAGAQSLADVAQKEASRRKAAGASPKAVPKKVYTNDDLKPAPAPSPGSMTPPAAPDAKDAAKDAAAQKDAAKKPEDEKGEEYWRARMSQAREALRRDEMFRDALQTRINSLTNDFSARDDPYQRAQLADDRQKAVAEMARVTQEIGELKKQIADIEEEARQSGVPPGWLR